MHVMEMAWSTPHKLEQCQFGEGHNPVNKTQHAHVSKAITHKKESTYGTKGALKAKNSSENTKNIKYERYTE